MMTPRTTPRWTRERPITRHCLQVGCGRATRSGKPYCSKHVDEHPYVRNLLAVIEGMHAEAAQVRQRGARAVDTGSLSSKEILLFLRVHGERSVPRLARDLNIGLKTLESYVKALEARSLVQLRENKRGAFLISFAEPSAKPRRRGRSSKQAADPTAIGDARDAIEAAG
jgi:hypothetical protein